MAPRIRFWLRTGVAPIKVRKRSRDPESPMVQLSFRGIRTQICNVMEPKPRGPTQLFQEYRLDVDSCDQSQPGRALG